MDISWTCSSFCSCCLFVAVFSLLLFPQVKRATHCDLYHDYNRFNILFLKVNPRGQEKEKKKGKDKENQGCKITWRQMKEEKGMRKLWAGYDNNISSKWRSLPFLLHDDDRMWRRRRDKKKILNQETRPSSRGFRQMIEKEDNDNKLSLWTELVFPFPLESHSFIILWIHLHSFIIIVIMSLIESPLPSNFNSSLTLDTFSLCQR